MSGEITPAVEWMTEEEAYGHPKPAEPKSWAIVVARDDDPPIAVSSWPEGSAEIARRFSAAWNATRGIHIEALEAGALAKALDLTVRLHEMGSDGDEAEARAVIGDLLASLRALGRLP